MENEISQIFINGRCFEAEKLIRRIKVNGEWWIAENSKPIQFRIFINLDEDKEFIKQSVKTRCNTISIFPDQNYSHIVISIIGLGNISGMEYIDIELIC